MKHLDKGLLDQLKDYFLLEKDRLVNESREKLVDTQIQTDDRKDQLDEASLERTQAMVFRLRSRDLLYLKKIDHALNKIESGEFGTCEECDEAIGFQRIKARPTATLCIDCKEEGELSEKRTIHGRKSKSYMKTFKKLAI